MALSFSQTLIAWFFYSGAQNLFLKQMSKKINAIFIAAIDEVLMATRNAG